MIEFLCFFDDFSITIFASLLHICPVLSRYAMNPTITNVAANQPKMNRIHKSSLVIYAPALVLLHTYRKEDILHHADFYYRLNDYNYNNIFYLIDVLPSFYPYSA